MTGGFKSAFHGVATVNDKGQVVIPAAARKAMELTPGEKLLVFGAGADTVMLCRISHMEAFASYFSQRLELAREALETEADWLDARGDEGDERRDDGGE